MRRYRLLKNYALAVGVVLVVVGVVGLAPSPPSPLVPNYPENLLHIGAGILFMASARIIGAQRQLRELLLGMGILLVLAKVVITVARWPQLGHEITVIGAICLVAGVGSMLIAALMGRTPPEG